MESWIYLFSKFTPEALLFEALFISTLALGYTGFWVLRKRKLGVIHREVPANVVKGYLNELIYDAEQLRAQLFGLLSAAGVQMPAVATQYASLIAGISASAPAAATGPAAAMNIDPSKVDPELLKKLSALEAKMVEQAKAMEAILADKTRLEKDLAEARAKGGSAAPASSSGEISKLQEKINALEGKLGEYSVIEDDLANLKRLQQENSQLKATLAGKGGGATPGEALGAALTGTMASSIVAKNAPAAEASAPAPEAAFEGLVDQVEQSLQAPEPSPLEAATGSPLDALTPAAPAAAEPAASPAKSDDDLVAEFEKMLNG